MNKKLEPFEPKIAIPAPESSYTVAALKAGAPCCEPIPIIEIKGLSISYHNQKVLQDINLTIHQGCITALIGPSGCGKTSFLSSLNRLSDLIPSCRVEGSIELLGQNVLAPNVDVTALRRNVGMIFQSPNPFPISIRRNIELGLRQHYSLSKSALSQRVALALSEVGLWDEVKDRLDSSALALSGGQQQRLCIARALALEPEVLLLDEPCSSLDPISTDVVENLIRKLSCRFTVVMVTHNLGQAQRLADFTTLFWNHRGAGELIEYGPTAEIFERPRHRLTAAYVNGRAG